MYIYIHTCTFHTVSISCSSEPRQSAVLMSHTVSRSQQQALSADSSEAVRSVVSQHFLLSVWRHGGSSQ